MPKPLLKIYYPEGKYRMLLFSPSKFGTYKQLKDNIKDYLDNDREIDITYVSMVTEPSSNISLRNEEDYEAFCVVLSKVTNACLFVEYTDKNPDSENSFLAKLVLMDALCNTLKSYREESDNKNDDITDSQDKDNEEGISKIIGLSDLIKMCIDPSEINENKSCGQSVKEDPINNPSKQADIDITAVVGDYNNNNNNNIVSQKKDKEEETTVGMPKYHVSGSSGQLVNETPLNDPSKQANIGESKSNNNNNLEFVLIEDSDDDVCQVKEEVITQDPVDNFNQKYKDLLDKLKEEYIICGFHTSGNNDEGSTLIVTLKDK